MRAFLLYRQKEWVNTGHYYDCQSIVQDLGLNTLFMAAAKELEKEDGKVKLVQEADTFIAETMKQVMTVPLTTKEEISYRQDMIRECLNDEALIRELYELSADTLLKWDKLGRRAKVGNRSSSQNVVTEIHVLQLLVDSLGSLKKILENHTLHSERSEEHTSELQSPS